MRRSSTALVVLGLLLTLGAKCEPTTAPSAAGSDSAMASAPTGTAAPASTAPRTPKVEKRIVTDTKALPFKTKRVSDPTLAEGRTALRRRGLEGVKTITYEVTITDGVQTSRKLIREVVTKAPVDRIIAVGTKREPQCDPNYSGACVPIASDVDCAGGSGDGPGYVEGPVRVVDSDIYDLDRDGDGVGCD
jgi:hypothetical protein